MQNKEIIKKWEELLKELAQLEEKVKKKRQEVYNLTEKENISKAKMVRKAVSLIQEQIKPLKVKLWRYEEKILNE